MKREEVFARDGGRCVYCAQIFPPEELTVDHVQPRVRGGDRSGGNLVTACRGCNTLKAHQPLANFLFAHPDAFRNFFRHALYVWPRHMRAIEKSVERRSRAADRSRG